LILLLFSSIIFVACHKQPAGYSCDKFVLYADASQTKSYHWWPSGWMGDTNAIRTLNESCTDNPHNGSTCIKIIYTTKNDSGWAGIYWLNENSWKGPGVNVYKTYCICGDCKLKVSFWYRGDNEGDSVQFKVGGVTSGNDSMELIETSWLVTHKTWTKDSLDLTGQDFSNLVGGFCWVIDNIHNPHESDSITLYLDDIIYEASE
jgi:hypothetical protein